MTDEKLNGSCDSNSSDWRPKESRKRSTRIDAVKNSKLRHLGGAPRASCARSSKHAKRSSHVRNQQT